MPAPARNVNGAMLTPRTDTELDAPRSAVADPAGRSFGGAVLGEANRDAARSEALDVGVEAPGDRMAACLAPSVGTDAVAEDPIPVARDHGGPARRTVGRAAREVVHVARIDVRQAVAQRDLAGTAERRRGRGRHVAHLPVRMERGEMQGHVG